MIHGILGALALCTAGLLLLAIAVSQSPECTIDDPPGPTIAGVIRIGGCP